MHTGKLPEAREYARRAMDDSGAAEYDNLDILLEATRLLATIEDQSGQIGEAIAVYKEYIDLADAQLPPGRELAMALYNFGAYMAEHGHREDGLTSLLRAADVAASSLGVGSFEEALALYGAAVVISKSGELVKADTYGRRALTILRNHEPKHRQELLCCVSLLAIVCQSQEKLVEADAFYHETIEAWESLGKPKLKAIVAALNSYGCLESQRGRLPHSKELLDMALEAGDELLGPADPERAALYNSYAGYYQAEGDVENTFAMYEKALHVWETAGWPNHPNLLVAYKNYTEVLATHKKYVELEPLLRRAMETCRKLLGESSRDEAIYWNELGVAVGSQEGRWDEAIRYFRNALAIWEAMNWPADDGVSVVHTNLFSLALMHGDFSVAVSTAESKLAYDRKHYGARHPALVGGLNNVGVAYREWGKFAPAEDYFEQAIRMVKCTLGSGHVELPMVLSNYARLRSDQGRERAAKTLKDRANRAARQLKPKRKGHR